MKRKQSALRRLQRYRAAVAAGRWQSLIFFALGGVRIPCHEIRCDCGASIGDQADSLPQKGHLIPDQEWFPVCDGIDAAIDDAAAGRADAEAAAMRARSILINAARPMYQCKECGRLFVDDRQHQLHMFAPASTETSREILRSRDGQHAT